MRRKTVLITGGNSFLSKEFQLFFSNNDKYQVYALDRKALNVEDERSIDSLFSSCKFDIVLHCAVSGGSRLTNDPPSVFLSNLTMFNNLIRNRDNFGIMINFGSGAEFDRSLSIDSCKEEDIFLRMPNDYYGCSKNLISRKIIEQNENVITLRLFGCFGFYENLTRFPSYCINRCLCNEDILVDGDREMDYFSSEDLFQLVLFFLNNPNCSLRDVNAVYAKKEKLSDIAAQIVRLTKSHSNVKISSTDNKIYSGSSEKISNLNLKFVGLEESMRKLINKRRISGRY